MKNFFFLFIVLFSFSSLASFNDQRSFACPENNYNYKGVTCCSDAVDFYTCKLLVDSLPLHVLSSVALVQSQHQNGAYDYGRVPNCFWNALNYKELLENKEPAAVGSFFLMDVLEEQQFLSSSDLSQLNVGDLLTFTAEGKMRDDVLNNNVPRRVWVPFASLEHAAIYIGGGLIFQKENIGTGVFSIDSLDSSRTTYERSFSKSPMYKEVHFKVEAWR